jgi:hypothetical protein
LTFGFLLRNHVGMSMRFFLLPSNPPMALLEILGGSFLQFFSDALTSKAARRHDAVKQGSEAMRGLAASISEIVSHLEAGVHRLERARNDPAKFSAELSDLVDQEKLQTYCHEAGVCERLRNAQDALRQAGNGFEGDAKLRVEAMAQEMDGYERVFVNHVRAFLAEARELDLKNTAGAVHDPDSVIPAMRDRVQRLRAIGEAAAGVSDKLREASKP